MIDGTDPRRTQFTYYGITSAAVGQLREYSKGDRDFATGDALKSLLDRGLCKVNGRFKHGREQARGLVRAAYVEGWHEHYDKR